jgi:hypothetical protein
MKTKWIKWPFTFFSYLLKPSIEIKPLISFHFWIMTILKNPQIQFIFSFTNFISWKKSNKLKNSIPTIQNPWQPWKKQHLCKVMAHHHVPHHDVESGFGLGISNDNNKKWNKWCNNFLWFFWWQIFTTWKQILKIFSYCKFQRNFPNFWLNIFFGWKVCPIPITFLIRGSFLLGHV